MEIKQASLYHLIDVLFLLKQCILDMNGKGLKQWNSAYPGPDQIREDIENGGLYIYTTLGLAKGMINLTEKEQDRYQNIRWKRSNGKFLYLNRFAVHPLWLDEDVSLKLIEFAEKYAIENKYTGLRLDVMDSYPVNESFFTGKNFEFAGDFHTDFQKMPYMCYEKEL